jgi:hypothetical protein
VIELLTGCEFDPDAQVQVQLVGICPLIERTAGNPRSNGHQARNKDQKLLPRFVGINRVTLE